MPIRVGVIGLSADKAAWAGVHFGAIQSNPDLFKLVALSTSSSETAKAAAAVYGIPPEKAYGSAEDLANDPDVDLVVVSVKTQLHKKLTLPAIQAGKDVILEWPIGKDLAEAEDIVNAAKAKGIKTAVGLQGRYAPSILKAKEIVESGAIGRILSTNFAGSSKFFINISERNEYVADVNNGATLVSIFGGHGLDTLVSILGEFASLSASTFKVFPSPSIVDSLGSVLRTIPPSKATSPDTVNVEGTLKSGAAVSYQMSSITTASPEYLTWIIHGEKGSLKLEGNPSISVFAPSLFEWKDGKWEEIKVEESNPVKPIAALYKAFGEGKKEGYVSFEEGLVRQRMIEAIGKSARDGTRESYDTSV